MLKKKVVLIIKKYMCSNKIYNNIIIIWIINKTTFKLNYKILHKNMKFYWDAIVYEDILLYAFNSWDF
jgi:hypothetical protein